MRDDTPSRTAAWVAAARHLGRLLPERLRLADDPFGAAFTSPVLAQLIEQAIDEAIARGLITKSELRAIVSELPEKSPFSREIGTVMKKLQPKGGRQ